MRRNLTGVALIVLVILYVFQIIRLWPILGRLPDIVPLFALHIGALPVAASVYMKAHRNEAVNPNEVFVLVAMMVATWYFDLVVLRYFVNR